MKSLLLIASVIVLSSWCAFAQLSSDSLVASYPFNGNVYDATGNGHNGVVTGGVSFGTSRSGGADSALVFDGTGYITIPNDSSLEVGSRFTIACWFKVTGIPPSAGWEGLVTKAGATYETNAGPRFMVEYFPSTGLYEAGSMAPHPYDESQIRVPLTVGEWYHYTLTADGDSVRQYLNDSLVFGWPQDYTWTFSNTNPITIGAQSTTFDSRLFVGSLDEVLVFARPLSAIEVAYLYDQKEPPTVSMVDTVAKAGDTVWIPVHIKNVSNSEILSYQFKVRFNAPDSILAATGSVVTEGTLTGEKEWSVLTNVATPNQISVAATGVTPMTETGDLVKLAFVILPGAVTGNKTTLKVSDIVLNAGSPVPSLNNGSITIAAGLCGDVDTNGTVQAYDAALTLRYAVGYNDSLSAQGLLNADVDQNGFIQAYDAGLILRHVVGLSMPDGVSPCFLTTNGNLKKTISLPSIEAALSELQGAGETARASLQFASNIAGTDLISLSFDVVLAANAGSYGSAILSTLPANYLGAVKKINSQRYSVAVVNPYGIDVNAVALTLSASSNNALSSVVVENVLLNQTASNSMTLYAGQSASSSPTSFALVGAYPNPFNPSTQVVFEVPRTMLVSLKVYDALGRSVCEIVNQSMDQGRYTATWNGHNAAGLSVASGRYFIRMQAGSFQRTIMVLLVK